MFFDFCRIKKKKNYQRKSSTLKHAVVNNSKCSKMESRIVRLFKVSFNLTQTHEVSNRKSQKTKLFHNMYYMTLLRYKFSQKEKKKILHKHSQNKYLFP